MNENDAIAVIAGVFMIVIVLAMIIAVIFFLLSLQKNLNAISESNRTMNPPMVWLNLIPLFNWGWMIYTAIKISESLEKEMTARNISFDAKPAYVLGLTFSIMNATGILWSWIPILGLLIAIGLLVVWIMYWVQISKFTKQLA
ncbi:MAG: hypothetical protein BMS9Abin11_1372 [Gammaproteobacteria bacterium]|nr:MAG: hypothetical protein BMS9Abin11_1372 [Gammaproteobacteria bacterium]